MMIDMVDLFYFKSRAQERNEHVAYASDRYGVPLWSNGTEAGNFNGPGETKDGFGRLV